MRSFEEYVYSAEALKEVHVNDFNFFEGEDLEYALLVLGAYCGEKTSVRAWDAYQAIRDAKSIGIDLEDYKLLIRDYVVAEGIERLQLKLANRPFESFEEAELKSLHNLMQLMEKIENQYIQYPVFPEPASVDEMNYDGPDWRDVILIVLNLEVYEGLRERREKALEGDIPY